MAEPKRHGARQDLLAKMLGELGHASAADGRRRPATIPRVLRSGSLPLSYAQERLWFFEQMRPGTAVYHIPMVFRLTGRLDEPRLRAALSTMVERHEVLRTVLRSLDSRAAQTVRDAMDLPFETGEAPTVAAALERVLAVASAPFDLADGPLLRVVLQRVGPGEWVLGVVLHHVVFDGWSMGVFVRELTTLYQGGQLDPLPIQYGDYAVWQRDWFASGVLDEQLDYWRQRLAGAPAALELPTDRPRPPVQSFRGAREQVTIPAHLTAAVRRLCQDEGVTPFMLLLTAFKVLISRYTGQTDIVVGAPIANRARVETEALLGYFINTVVLRTDLSGEPTGRELLARVRDTALGAYAHQDLPFERLVDELRPERDLSRSALFQTLFVLQNAPTGRLDLPELAVAPLAVDTGIAKFDLTFDLQEAGDRITGEVEYSTDLFDRDIVRGLFAAYMTLLTALTADPGAPVSRLPVLDEGARLRLDEPNATEREWTGARLLHELVEEQAGRTPEATALICGAERLTYRDLNSRADRLAHRLRERGVGPDVVVGLCVERSADLVTGLLGVLKAGGAYLPMDPDYPTDRLTYMVEDSGTRVVLTDSAHAGRFAAPHVTLLDDLLDGPAGPERRPASGAGPGNLAYVIYTSGSTGRPKGVMIEHRTIVNHLRGTIAQIGFTAGDRLLAVTTVSFDIAGLEIFAPLSVGATCVLTAPGESADAAALMRLLDRHDITLMQATPATWRLLLDSGWAGRPGLRLLCGGEAFPPDLAAELTARTAEVWNMYGPTETTVWSLTTCVEPPGPATTTVPIGSPMANTRGYIVDRLGRRVPPGVTGELLIGGHGVARGYLGRPGLTAERFVPDVHGGRPGERLYRTGDLVRQRPDGRLEFLGRVDHQVKLRGFRIELGEIEAALSRQEHVRACAVVLREDKPGDRRLVGYLVGDNVDLSVSAIRDDLKRQLPDYMIPSALVVLDALPLTANGKVDRTSLPAPATGRDQLGTPFTPAVTATERVLAGIWAEVLGVPADQVGVHDNFFELGGNSLLAVALVSRISTAVDVRVPLQDLFARPTVAAVVAMLAARPGGAEEDVPTAAQWKAGTIARVPRDGSLPLSFAQERLWFFEQLRPGTAVHHVPAVFRLRGRLDERKLRDALAGVVARHEVLRTVYPAVDGKAGQVILDDVDLPFETDALSGLGVAAFDAALRRTESVAAAGFDLTTGPLLRALLLRIGAEDHLFAVVMHHIVFDAWTMGVFVRELTQLYQGDRPAPLTVQYADYAVWQRRLLESGELDAEAAYWRERLAGAPALLELPTDRPRPPVQSFQGDRRTLVLPTPLTAAVRRTAHSEGVTTFMLLLTAFKLVLSRYSGQTDIVVGAPIAGRTHIDTEPLIGFFINTLALRTDLSGDPTVRELLARVRETTLGGLAHQELPFERLVDELQPRRDLSHSPLFQVLLNYQDEAEIDVQAGGVHWSVEPDSTRASNFDLTLYALEKAAGLELAVAYSADLFDADRIQVLLGHLVEALRFVTAAPESPVSALHLTGPAGTENAPAAGGEELAAAFARQAGLHPGRVALVDRSGPRTYRQLAGDIEDLVARLRELGVGRRDRLRITCRRDHRMVVGLLAAAGIGCTAVLVSDRLPDGRLERLDAAARPTVRLLPDGDSGLRIEPADERVPGPEGFGYVLFTSGSTGMPKAVLADGWPLSAFLDWYREEFALTDADRFAVLSASGHDPLLRDVLTPLVVGATSYWPEEEVLRDPARLLSWLAGHGITVLNLSPALGGMLRTVSGAHPVPSVRLVGSGGDVLTAPLVQDLRRLFPAAEVANYYGATETPQVVSCHRVPGDAATGSVPLGRGANGAVLEIRRPDGVPAGTSELGEIHVRSRRLARGYLESTVDGLVVRPLGTAGTDSYPTGDLGRYRPDGLIDFHGRRDRQAKVRGYRIEPADIEAALAALPHVAESAVAVEPGTDWLFACAVLDHRPADVDRLRDELRNQLRAQLPEYMLPQLVLTHDPLPRLATAKVDTASLVPFARERFAAGRAKAEPGSPLELILAEVWTSTLEVAPARLDESFFDTGNSLLLTQFVARVNAVLGPHLAVADAFHNPTVAALSKLLAGTPAEHAARELLADVQAELKQEEGSPL
ncbi:non-ribosomal peptide synthetase [Micromonospora coerulea]|uniref:non-ribosomal peptide synthetase n=1 Tax=Micromonospora coerulea TaxID=47856 RepID=UPI0019044791|nr:non-ribosomal peptide synthetase [Micromonospora veneta]